MSVQTGNMRELPRYICHKQVWALKVKDIQLLGDGGAMLLPEEPGYGPIAVNGKWMMQHEPKVGGYYVVYQDGYTSWSPAAAFEDGYTLDKTEVVR